MCQIHTLQGHSGPVTAAAASEASGLILTSDNSSVWLWQIPKEADDTCKPRSSAVITAVAWAPHGSLVVSGNEAGELTLWQKAQAVATARAPGRVSDLIWCSADAFFVLSANENVSEWQVELRKGSTCTNFRLYLKRVLQEDLGVLTGLALAPDGQSLILMKEDVELLQMKPGSTPSSICRRYAVHSSILCTSKDYGVFYLQQRNSGSLSILEQKESGKFEKTLDFNLNLNNPNGSPVSITQAKPESESSLLCATSDGMLWNLSECTPEGEWVVGNIWQKKPRNPESPTPGTDSSPGLFCMDSWAEPTHLKARQCKKIHLGSVTALHVLPGLLVTASEDRDVKLWERPSMQLLGLFRCEGPVSCLEPWMGPSSPPQLAVGDAHGNLYFLSWE